MNYIDVKIAKDFSDDIETKIEVDRFEDLDIETEEDRESTEKTV